MTQPRILVIQDISASCRISSMVALPVLSCLNNEVNLLPTALLSTHTTSGFHDYTYLDLTDEWTGILAHWEKLGLQFDGILIGYLASTSQVNVVERIIDDFLKKDGKVILDPVMGDDGELYSGFDEDFVCEMRRLAGKSSVLLPNITAAQILLAEETVSATAENEIDRENEPTIDEIDCENKPANQNDINTLIKKVAKLNHKDVIITGVAFDNNQMGAISYDHRTQTTQYHDASYYEGQFEGGGDLFSSIIAGLTMHEKSIHDSMIIAVDYVNKALYRTSQLDDDKIRYGIQFETDLSYLIEKISKN